MLFSFSFSLLPLKQHPANTRRCFNVETTLLTSKQCCINVKQRRVLQLQHLNCILFSTKTFALFLWFNIITICIKQTILRQLILLTVRPWTSIGPPPRLHFAHLEGHLTSRLSWMLLQMPTNSSILRWWIIMRLLFIKIHQSLFLCALFVLFCSYSKFSMSETIHLYDFVEILNTPTHR